MPFRMGPSCSSPRRLELVKIRWYFSPVLGGGTGGISPCEVDGKAPFQPSADRTNLAPSSLACFKMEHCHTWFSMSCIVSCNTSSKALRPPRPGVCLLKKRRMWGESIFRTGMSSARTTSRAYSRMTIRSTLPWDNPVSARLLGVTSSGRCSG